jgi:anti-sigma regulatory factor (Ser/Thr protein kinase)
MTDQDGGWTEARRRHLQLTLPAAGQPARLARQVTREVLPVWRLAHAEEVAVLLVSELVSNAVRHAGSADVITLELKASRGWLRIEVYRCRPGLTAQRIPGEFDESGLGLVLVDSLADKWGVRETVTGKTMWAELDVRGEPGPWAR